MRRLPRLLRVGVIAVLALSSLGCARFYWVKSGSTPEEFARDSAACEKEATVSVAAAPSIVQNIYRTCLTSKGYVREEHLMPGSSAHRGIEKWD